LELLGRTKSIFSNSRRPASIFEKSSTSFTIERSDWALLSRISSKLPLLGLQVRLQEHRGHAEDAIQRRAHLVAHVGDELRFGGIGRLGISLARRMPAASWAWCSAARRSPRPGAPALRAIAGREAPAPPAARDRPGCAGAAPRIAAGADPSHKACRPSPPGGERMPA